MVNKTEIGENLESKPSYADELAVNGARAETKRENTQGVRHVKPSRQANQDWAVPSVRLSGKSDPCMRLRTGHRDTMRTGKEIPRPGNDLTIRKTRRQLN
jgi:hypothetical protein